MRSGLVILFWQEEPLKSQSHNRIGQVEAIVQALTVGLANQAARWVLSYLCRFTMCTVTLLYNIPAFLITFVNSALA